jgi:transposase
VSPLKHIILFVDGAGWHRAKDLIIPSNITFYFLPPYSPELNPIERLWSYMKQNFLSRKIFDDMNDIFNGGQAAWSMVSEDIVKSVCKMSLNA